MAIFHILNAVSHSAFAFLLYIAIAVFAVIAAWRHRMKGLRILAAAVLLTSISDLLRLVCGDPNFSNQHPQAVFWLTTSTFAPIIGTLVALVGWAALAFGRRAGKGPNS